MNEGDKSTDEPVARAVIAALRRIIRATDLDAKRLAREADLTISQWLVLEILAVTGATTPGQISKALGLAHATVTNVLDRLEERGLIARGRDEADRHLILVRLTPQGVAGLSRAPSPLQQRFLERFAALADWEQSAILAALQRVARLMDAAHLDAASVLDVGAIDRQPTPAEDSA
ncbi:MAG: MarR family transcriptional regulator [Alphaproteobacteria bacterium]|nr:MAG: MarR family transcriptional regulator [Alphaproteobacteria bacterium]